jgi:hypothetical protein
MKDDLPWMLPTPAFEWIETNIASGGTILEFGSGEGSKRLAMTYSLYSVEHNPEWLNVSGGNYLYAPIKLNDEFNNEIGWYDLEPIKHKLPTQIDLMIIDGPNGTIGRSGLLNHTDLFSWDFPVLIDDLHREQEYLFSQHLSSKCSLKCIHYGHLGDKQDGTYRSYGVFSRYKRVNE